ncbi:carboxypeptidase-like regulatory domain-containing protein, partial [Patescibacteria group bacterium]
EIHIQTLSDNNGLVSLPGIPSCTACYEISVTKTGFSTDRTYSTDEVDNPLKPHATIISGDITQVAMSIDKLSRLTINSYNLNYQAVANVTCTLRGNKIIGYDIGDNPVYKHEQVVNTGGYTVSIPLLEWDTYILDFSDSAHSLAGSNPIIPFALYPNANLTIPIVVVPKSNASLLVIVKNPSGQLLASASATLTNSILSYDVTKFTPSTGSANFGQSFFESLSPETYDLIVSLPGYEEATASVIIDSNQQKSFILNHYQL